MIQPAASLKKRVLLGELSTFLRRVRIFRCLTLAGLLFLDIIPVMELLHFFKAMSNY